MEGLQDKLSNFDYWTSIVPSAYDITAYDLSSCKARITNKQTCHKCLSNDISLLIKTFPDDKDKTKSLKRMEKKLKNIGNDKINKEFWKTTAAKLYSEHLKREAIQAETENTTRKVINKTAVDVFGLARNPDVGSKRKLEQSHRDEDQLPKRSTRSKAKLDEMEEADNIKIGDGPSVGTIIKREAIKLFKKGTPTDSRKYKIMTNGLSSILDVADITETSQKALFDHSVWCKLESMYTQKYSVSLIEVPGIVLSTWRIVCALIKKSRDTEAGLKYLYQIYPKHMKKPYFYLLKICEHMLELVDARADMLLGKNDYSENDYLSFIWSRFFNLLFPSKEKIKIKTGETTSDYTAWNKSQLYTGSSNIVGFKIDIRFLVKHSNIDIDLCAAELARNDGDEKIIDDEGKLNREAKDILDNLVTIIPQSKSTVSSGWTFQIGGSSCFVSSIHLDANGLYVVVPQYQFVLPASLSELDLFPDILAKLLTFRQSMYSIADVVQETLNQKHSVGTALGRAGTNEEIDPRICWIRDSYYTPPRNTAPIMPTCIFGVAPPPSSILDRLLSVSYEERKANDSTYKGCKFDENGWTFYQGHWYNSITEERVTSSPYNDSDNESEFNIDESNVDKSKSSIIDSASD
ncbi:uncharacterized protein ATC70_013249 [Mucor velutinosus]|uniref:Uncharacterized protein n=1 Tax=Mucor velutinosus TaxID=708070 RepID=A0AAN7D7K7_9FUNG|nr:hypothetical protein ATC70_013249 [Mucor velutinosus]